MATNPNVNTFMQGAQQYAKVRAIISAIPIKTTAANYNDDSTPIKPDVSTTRSR
jgi:hypothetical protein